MTTARLVVPTERHVERLACAGVRAETRGRLCERLLVVLAPDAVFASPAEVRLTLTATLGRDGASAAWSADVDAAIGELRAGNVDPDDLADTGRARVLASAMYALDETLRARGRIDPRRARAVLARALRTAEPSDVVRAIGSTHVAARGIVAWDMADLAWWRALDDSLSRAGGSAKIELPAIDRRLDPDRDRTPLEVVSDEIAVALESPPLLDPIDAPLGDLSFHGPLAVDGRVELRSAVDARGQARAAVDAVVRALESGASIERIAIAVPPVQPDVVAPIAELLESAGVAATGATSARMSGLAVCALDALSIASRGLRRESVAALLRSPYVRLAEGATTARTLARALEETATERGSDSVSSLEATARAWPEAESFDVVPLSRRVGEILSLAEMAQTIGEQVATTRAMWAALGIGPHVDGVAAAALARDGTPRGLARADVRASARDARAWSRIEATLDVLARLTSPAIAPDELRVEIELALEVESTTDAAAAAAAVRIASVEDLANEPLDVLVLVDANEGGVGSPPPRTSLLTGVVVTGDPSRTSLPSHRVRTARALAELAVAASGARRVVVCHRDRESDGTLLPPARLVTWLLENGIIATRWSAAPLAGTALTRAEARLDAIAAGGAVAPDASRRARIEHAREALFETPDAAPSDVCGVVTLDAARVERLREATGGGDRALAITSLEQIAQCPFKGFASVVLRARGDAMLGEAPEARELGTLVHRALAAAFVATEALWRKQPRDRDAILARALTSADIVLNEGDPESSLRRLARMRARDDVVAVLEWSLADETWSFARAEQAFGSERTTSWPALVLHDGATSVRLRGSIDRVDTDIAGRAIRAIDYKTSEAAANAASKSLGETTFQAALYASAAAAALDATSTDAIYLPTNGRALRPGYARSERATAAWKYAIEEVGGRTRAEGRALDVVRGLRDGQVAPHPADPSICASCSFDGGCRKPRFAIARADDDEGVD